MGAINRGRHCDNEHVAVRQIARIGAVPQVDRLLALCWRGFLSAVVACLQFINAWGMGIEPDDGEMFAKLNSQWQTHITKANEGNAVGRSNSCSHVFMLGRRAGLSAG
ncbi:hypothetical protein D3C72_2179660 [compost metagenome]